MSGKRQVTYLIVGGFNTLVGYALVVGLYYALSPYFNIVVIGVLGNVLAITVSFCTYKTFVFKTVGRWLREYLRSYLIYGSMALLSIFILWVFVEKLAINIWIAQGVSMALTAVLSYIGHSRFTFKRNKY